MRVMFVAIGWEQLSVSLLSALAKQHGHQTALAFSAALFADRHNFNSQWLGSFFSDDESVLKKIVQYQPQVLVFSPVTATYQWMLGIARRAKILLPQVKMIWGGAHASAVPELVIQQKEVDYLCVGEGDVAFLKILRHIEKGSEGEKIPNTWYKTNDLKIIRGASLPFWQDLDSLPFFDKPLWENDIPIGEVYLTMASRGCPQKCVYCANSFYRQTASKDSPGAYVRFRGSRHVIQELKAAKVRYKIKMIDFTDDMFTANRTWLFEFLDLYQREIRTPFQCMSSAQYLDDEILRRMAEEGCQFIQIGVQSANEEYKRNYLKRSETRADFDRAFQACRKYGIGLKVDHMFALPNEPFSAQEEARQLYDQYRPFRIQIFWTTFLPGTQLTNDAIQQKRLSTEQAALILQGHSNDYFHGASPWISFQAEKKYQAYEVIFKLYQILPRWIHLKKAAGVLIKMPRWVNGLLAFLSDFVSGLVKRNPDHWAYAKYYLFHLLRILKTKIGLKKPSRFARVWVNEWPLLSEEVLKDANHKIGV